MNDRPLRDRLDEAAQAALEHRSALREAGVYAPWGRARSPLYDGAFAILADAAHRSGVTAFAEGDAAAALAASKARLDSSGAPAYDRREEPPADDVRAFLRSLEGEEAIRSDGRGGYVLDPDAAPF